MDHIIQALERAKETQTSVSNEGRQEVPPPSGGDLGISDVELSVGRLERMRVVAHDPGDPRSKSFDLLRTQVLQTMDANGWRIVAITSPRAGCGKTFTAINLALSIARQPDSAVMLVDMDLQQPQVGQRLGIQPTLGVRALLEARASFREAITNVSVSGLRFSILPCERASSRSSDWVGSPQMAKVIKTMRADRNLRVVLLDLPPLLSGDDVISILPQVDCVMIVAAVGSTTTVELKECAQFLKSTPLVRIVLNKVTDVPSVYY